jgi:two-component system, chemotaxis family, chemotaxis protein CheV
MSNNILAAAGPTTSVDSGVLLEAGTNEVEILVFRVGDQRFGVNVAKVREVRNKERVLHLPRYPQAVLGVIQIRGAVVPLVDLRSFLGGYDENPQHDDQQADLLLEYNDRLVAFRVQGIDRVFRVSWKDLMPLPKCPGMQAPVTGIILLEGGIVTLLDFESIGAVLGVNGDGRLKCQDPTQKPARRNQRPLVYVDDSPLIRRMLADALTGAGYGNIQGFSDGQEAWDYLAQIAADVPAGGIGERVSCVVSDIEMPRMDGFHLTKRIRENATLQTVPVVLFSSLISKDNEKKGKQVGATAQVSKPRWEDLATTLTKLLDEVIAE